MPRFNVHVQCPLQKSFRAEQVRGMFDLKAAKIAKESFAVELPGLDEDWRIGAIVGPSGSGKTAVARKAFGENFHEGKFSWPEDRAVVDAFDEKNTIQEITHTLTSVGFSSPPAWLKPYRVLSGGERFRCDLARALLSSSDVCAFDEFTSVVDRTVAKIGSAAVSKSIRKERIAKKFVAVTCHYDVLEWLEPDWVLDMASCQLARGCLYERPRINVEVAPIHYSAWVLFRRHHYLNTNILVSARCFAAFWGEEPVAFSAWINMLAGGAVRYSKREHRTVVLPDYQGVGIGNRLSEFCASIYAGLGYVVYSTTSHPAMIRYRVNSPNWAMMRFGRATGQNNGSKGSIDRKHALRTLRKSMSRARITGGFRYRGPKMNAYDAARFVGTKPRVFAPLLPKRSEPFRTF